MYVAVSRAPYPEIAAYHKRMGWPFKWVSSFGSDFNFDYHVSFTEADKARGKVFYNFETADIWATRCRAAACSSGMKPARYSTPIRRSPAAPS